MQLSKILLGILGFQSIVTDAAINADMLPTFDLSNVSPIPAVRANTFISKLNMKRRGVLPAASGMPQVSWNANLANKLLYVNPKFYFKSCNMTGPLRISAQSYCGFNLMKMYPFNEQFPGFNFLIHDTFVRPQKLIGILNYRLGQINKCLNFRACKPTIYSNFESCAPKPVLIPGKECSWATQYGPALMRDDYNQVACSIFKEHGPSAPKAQLWSFFCYSNMKEALNDVPYVKGERCSDCAPLTPICKTGLCVPHGA